MGKLIKEQSLILETRKGLVIIREIIYKLKDLGVEKVASSHCTGEEAINLFKESGVSTLLKVAVELSSLSPYKRVFHPVDQI